MNHSLARPGIDNFCSCWTLLEEQEVTVFYSCWTMQEADKAMHKLQDAILCKASIAPYEDVAQRCIPCLGYNEPHGVGWVVLLPRSLDDEDWSFEQQQALDTWVATVLVNRQGTNYLPTGSLESRVEEMRVVDSNPNIVRSGEPSVLDDEEDDSDGPVLKVEYLPGATIGIKGPYKNFENALINAQLLAAEKGVDVKIRHQDVVVTKWFIDWEEPPPQAQSLDNEEADSGDDEDHWPPDDEAGSFLDHCPDSVSALMEYEQEEIRRESYDGSPFGVEDYARSEDSGWYED